MRSESPRSARKGGFQLEEAAGGGGRGNRTSLPRSWTGSGRGTKWFSQDQRRDLEWLELSTLHLPPSEVFSIDLVGKKEVPLLRLETQLPPLPPPLQVSPSLQSSPSGMALPAGLPCLCWSLIPPPPFLHPLFRYSPTWNAQDLM